jgi:hypothetical protein
MAYNTVPIKKDVDGKPIPQYFNPLSNQYEDLQGSNGANRVMVYDINGNIIDLTALLSNIVTAINNLKTTVDIINNKDTTKTFYGLSTDTKPTTDMIKGNKFFEINTGNVYMWNGTQWVVI